MKKKIFITTGGGIGDLIMFTPALRRLKEIWPQCKIIFMTIDKTVDVINRIPYIDKVVCIKRGRFLGRYRVLPDLWGSDIVIFTDWQPHILPFSWLFRIKTRAGIPRKGHLLTHCLTHPLVNNVFKSTRYAAQTNAMIFSEALGISIDGDMTKCDVSIPGIETRHEVDELLESVGIDKDGNFLLLTPFASFDRRNWDIQEAKKFMKMVEQQWNIPIVVTGIANNEQVQAVDAKCNLFNKTTILQLIELIRRAKCVVTPDSGPIHIAGALNTYVISLFSKDLPSRWAPKRNCSPIYLNYECSPCDDDTARQCATVKCMKNITAEMVFDTLMEAETKYHFLNIDNI